MHRLGLPASEMMLGNIYTPSKPFLCIEYTINGIMQCLTLLLNRAESLKLQCSNNASMVLAGEYYSNIPPGKDMNMATLSAMSFGWLDYHVGHQTAWGSQCSCTLCNQLRQRSFYSRNTSDSMVTFCRLHYTLRNITITVTVAATVMTPPPVGIN